METPMMLISRHAIAVLKARQADESRRGTHLDADTLPGRSKWDDAATDSPRAPLPKAEPSKCTRAK
jgi:hypothetical protein